MLRKSPTIRGCLGQQRAWLKAVGPKAVGRRAVRSVDNSSEVKLDAWLSLGHHQAGFKHLDPVHTTTVEQSMQTCKQ